MHPIHNCIVQFFRTLIITDIYIKIFIYKIGNQDFVRCFHCGIGLRNWEEDDDPYVEHCRWSPNCQYMKLKKGQAFIDAVQDAVRQVQLVCILWKLKLSVLFSNQRIIDVY